jgi:hypothetical protein
LSGDGITVDNNDSIWAYRPDIGALMLAREGDNVDVGSGIIRRYRNFSLITASSGQDGLPSSFNASNQFVFRNEYWDFKDGIVVLAIPEPASFGLLLLPLLIRRKRKG